MNLLAFFLSAMMAKDSLDNLSKKSGVSTAMIRRLLPLAIPLLIRYMTANASSGNGAQSLLGALAQHTNKRTIAEQIRDADETDGDKIIHHILGNDNDKVVKELATRSGMNTMQVIRLLALLAPAMLSALSAASGSAAPQTAAQPKPANDFSTLLSMFGGAAAQPQSQTVSSGSGLLGALLGHGSAQQPAAQAEAYSSLSANSTPAQAYSSLSANSTPAGGSPLGGLSGLLGALSGTPSAPAQVQESAFDGSDLLALLAQIANK